MKRVLVTGPVDRLAEYAASARAAGWEAIETPLLRIEARRFQSSDLAHAQYDWICVTSASALPWLQAAIEARPDLRASPVAAVGERTAERVRALGLALDSSPALDAEVLAAGLAARARAGARVLWPRGSVSGDLASALRAARVDVDDPIAYETRTLERSDPFPPSTAIFFASPSAVRAWHEQDAESDPRLAIAIGRTTFDALLHETQARFFDTISLPQPTPEAFAAVLAHLDPEKSR
jgi:uroporphyrinogen-III synthase